MSNHEGPRKSVLSIRIEPRLRFLVDIATRAQRRNLTNFIESAIHEAIRSTEIEEGRTVWDARFDLWDTNEDQIILNLSAHFPDLLTFEEQVRLKELQNE